jgi:uncharacterized heparinase superfamily protein
MMVDGGVTLRSVFGPALAGLGRFRSGFARVARFDLGGPRIDGIGLPLQPLVRGNAARAIDYYRGSFAWAGTAVECMPGEIFASRVTPQSWTNVLYRFDWLHDLAATGQALHLTLARRMVTGWVAATPARQANNLGVLDRRIFNLLLHAQYLVPGAGDDFRSTFYRALSRDLANLRAAQPQTLTDQFNRALVLFAASVSLRGCESYRDAAATQLHESLIATILPDGGHVSRNPGALLDVVLDLIPVVRAMRAAHKAVPQAAEQAVERIFPMLRMMCHGDGGLAHFQGAGYLRAGDVEQVLACDASAGKPLHQAPYSGYCRTTQGTSALVLDAGLGPACESPLAFEFSSDTFRIFTNCAMPEEAPADWREAASRTAAHNTAELSSTTRRLKPAGRNVSAEVIPSPHGVLMRGVNAACAAATGLHHHRDLFLASGGHDLRGEDRFVPTSRQTSTREIQIRFHLHPSIRASQARNGSEAWLLLPNRSAWRFLVRGGQMVLEESVYLADPSGPRKTSQLVVRTEAPAETAVKWALRRIDKPPRHHAADNETPELPF